jgi:hypothetical protein
MPNPVFTLTFNCPLSGIWRDDTVYIRTKDGRFADQDYPGYVLATVLGYQKSTCAGVGEVWEYTFEATTALPSGVSALQECDIDGIRLSQDCCIVSGAWVGDEIHLTQANGDIIVIPSPTVTCYGYPDSDPAGW